MAVRLWAPLFVGLVAAASGKDPKPKASDYPARARGEGHDVAAEYLVRSVSGANRTIVIDDYLVVEVAVYPDKGRRLTVTSGQFRLRLNGKKDLLIAQPAGFVAASLKYADWTRRPTLTGSVGSGAGEIIINRPQPGPRFPGDNRESQNRLPPVPRAPAPETRTGLEKPDPVQPEEIAAETALPEGETAGPIAGHLYFPHRGKTKSIRKVELVYDGPGGPLTLRLL